MAEPAAVDWLYSICGELGNRANADGLEALTPAQRAVLLATWGKGLVDNGGFGFFYAGASNAGEVAKAFDVLGLAEAAQAFRDSAQLFPTPQLQAGWQDWREWMDAHGAELEPEFERLNRAIWNLDPDAFDSKLLEFIRQHPSDFAGLVPA